MGGGLFDDDIVFFCHPPSLNCEFLFLLDLALWYWKIGGRLLVVSRTPATFLPKNQPVSAATARTRGPSRALWGYCAAASGQLPDIRTAYAIFDIFLESLDLSIVSIQHIILIFFLKNNQPRRTSRTIPTQVTQKHSPNRFGKSFYSTETPSKPR